MENSITIEELKKILKPTINLIDIRNANSYKMGHIKYAKNISKNELMFNTEKYLKKEVPYYIYCSKGIQSRGLVNYLNKQGYNTKSVLGGYINYNK